MRYINELILSLASRLFAAFVGMQLWNWYLAGFAGLPIVNYRVAVGAFFVASLVLGRIRISDMLTLAQAKDSLSKGVGWTQKLSSVINHPEYSRIFCITLFYALILFYGWIGQLLFK